MVENAEIAWSYFEHLGEGRFDEAAAFLRDDGTWWTNGSRRTRPMPEHKALFPQVLAVVPMRYTRRGSVEEGDVVVLELESDAELPDGARFHNVYSFVITVQDGRILHVREYSDTAHVAAVAPSIKALYASGS